MYISFQSSESEPPSLLAAILHCDELDFAVFLLKKTVLSTYHLGELIYYLSLSPLHDSVLITLANYAVYIF